MTSNIYPNANRFSMLIKSVVTTPGLFTHQIQPYQVALVDTTTWKTVSSASDSDNLIVVVGSPNKGIKKNPLTGNGDTRNFLNSYKSREFSAIEKGGFYTLSPKEAKPFIGYYGWDGVNDCKSPKYECGKTYGIQIRVTGELIKQIYGQYEISEDIFADSPCCNPCDDSCTTSVDCNSVFKEFVRQANDLRDGQNNVAMFGKFSLVHDPNCAETITKISMNKWCLSICDTGDTSSLQSIQSAYPTESINLIKREGSISTYQLTNLSTTPPAPYTATLAVTLAECNGTCPKDYIIQSSSTVITVERPLGGTEDFTTQALKNAYAQSVATDYSGTRGTFVSYSTTSAIVTVSVTAPTTALLADKIVGSYTSPSLCIPSSGTGGDWVSCGKSYKTTRTLCITVKLDDCVNSETSISNILADINTSLLVDDTYVSGSAAVLTSGNCVAVFSVSQYSNELDDDGCDTIGVPTFKNLTPYKSYLWDECPCTEKTLPVNPCKCGIKVEGFTFDCKEDGCYTDLNKYKNYELPKFEITPIDPIFDKCSDNPVTDFFVAQNPEYETLDGKRVLREIIDYRVGFLNEPHYSAGDITPTALIDLMGLETGTSIDQCGNYHVVHTLVKYDNVTHRTDATDQLQDIQLFFEDIVTRDKWIHLMSTFSLKPQVNVPVRYEI